MSKLKFEWTGTLPASDPYGAWRMANDIAEQSNPLSCKCEAEDKAERTNAARLRERTAFICFTPHV
ncbi:hypothetical protein [Paenibacillus solanacearum]|uniref:hypothetical protein n=1 Tax=Paenibacillus solanacearum TaxID=2048548 RepID=UPI001C406EA1|nr:hypothetical protein [Paenibacillus solanacearum]